MYKTQVYFIKRFNEKGKVTSVKNYGWQRKVMALMPAAAKPSIEDN